MRPIEFNVPIHRDNWQSLAAAQLEEHAALLEAPDFRLRREQDGVAVHTRDVRVSRGGPGGPVATQTLLTRTSFDVSVSREQAFALVGDPTRGAEWDPLDRGHELVEAYDESHAVMRTLSKPPPPWGMRESVLYMVSRRPSGDASAWDLCARAVSHPGAPAGPMPRVLQQVYGWRVTPLGPGAARVTGLATIPENLLPVWLLKLANVGGWMGLARKVRRLIQVAP